MKIHIVQNGDTLYLLAKSYKVELANLIESNPQLANPDILMPGMKITIPTNKKQINLVDKETKKAKPELMKRPIGEMKEDDHKARRIDEQNKPLYPVVPIGEAHKVEEQVQEIDYFKHQVEEKSNAEEIAYTREEGGMRELPVEERPLISPPQHRLEFTLCCHCNQPIYQHKQN